MCIKVSNLAKMVLSAALFSGAVCTTSLTFADDPAPTPAPATPPAMTTPAAAPKQEAAAGSTARVSGKRALDRLMPEVKFSNTPLSDVIDFFADTTNANFDVDWKSLDAVHIAKDTNITLRLNPKVPLHKVLDMVLQQAAGTNVLTYYVEAGVVEITSQEASDKKLIPKTYPIQDLLFQPTDYNNAPDLSLQNASQGQTGGGGSGGGGGGGGGQSLFNNANSSSQDTNSKNTQQDRAAEIIKLIQDTVKPELWQVNGGTATISFFRGSLIVNAPRSIHEMLESQ